MGAHTRTVGHHGQPSGVWGPGGRPKGGARELPFPMAAECAGGAQRVKVEHPRAERPPPVSYLDARSGDGHNRAAGKGNQQPNHPPGAPTNPQPPEYVRVEVLDGGVQSSFTATRPTTLKISPAGYASAGSECAWHTPRSSPPNDWAGTGTRSIAPPPGWAPTGG